MDQLFLVACLDENNTKIYQSEDGKYILEEENGIWYLIEACMEIASGTQSELITEFNIILCE